MLLLLFIFLSLTFQFIAGKNHVDDLQSLELSFPVTTSHFHNNKARLKCLATIAGLYWKTADVTLSQEHPKLLQTKDGKQTIFISSVNNIDSLFYDFLRFLYISEPT